MLGFGAIGQFAIGEGPSGVAAETITPDKWYVQFVDPVKFPARLLAGAQLFQAFYPDPLVSFGWFEPLGEPMTRERPRLQASLHPFVGALHPEPVVSFGWFAALGEPAVRVVPALPTPEQQAFAPSPEPVVSFSWFEGLSEPSVRVAPTLAAGEHPVFTTSPLPLVSFSWFEGLSEPVRFAPRLPAGEQSALAFTWSPTVISIDWFQAFADPTTKSVRGLRASEQQFLAYHPRILPNPNITGVLDADDPFDTAVFGGLIWNRAVSVQVSITELSSPTAFMSVYENAEVTVTATVTGMPPSATSATAVTTSTAASVSIREI